MKPSRWVALGASAGLLAAVLGAYGAHGLRDRILPERFAMFETGVRYAFYHALALLAVGLLAERRDSGLLRAAGWAFVAGLLLFSGGVMMLAATGAEAWGRAAPLGGISMMAGWACLAAHAWRTPPSKG